MKGLRSFVGAYKVLSRVLYMYVSIQAIFDNMANLPFHLLFELRDSKSKTTAPSSAESKHI